MAKILLVEDDNNLREIYEARLQAEGYTIVSAHDGEEALVVAKAEKPELIISDVMMPKISGFEMLDILRNTDSLKAVKVMMLTALGQNDDQERADKLGADRYLVKSQVTLEDIVTVANELLNNVSPINAVEATPTNSEDTQATTTAPPDIALSSTAAADDTQPATPPPASEPVSAPVVDTNTVSDPVVEDQVTTPPTDSSATSEPPTDTPLSGVPVVDTQTAATPDNAESTDQEKTEVNSQIETFMNTQLSANDGPAPTEPAPHELPTPPPASDEGPMIKSSSSGLSTEPPASETAESDSPAVDDVSSSPSDDAKPAQSPPPSNELGHLGGNRVIEPLPDTETKTDINTLIQKEEASEIISSTVDNPDAPPVLPPQDTAPTPVDSVISPQNP